MWLELCALRRLGRHDGFRSEELTVEEYISTVLFLQSRHVTKASASLGDWSIQPRHMVFLGT